MNMFGLGTGLVKKKDSKKEREEKPDRLRPDAFASAEKALLAASGVPGTADALAYEPIQGLVAISTSDGKIKLFGRPGCEATVYSAARYPYATRQLQFLQNRGVLVRVSKGGIMECWSIASSGPGDGGVRTLGRVKVRHDKICCVADMASDPYVLLGCASGSLRIAMLVDSTGNPTTNPRQARGFTVEPYRVRTKELCGSGEVRQLAVQSFGDIHRVLVLFTAGIVSVWDLRAAELVTSLDPGNDTAYPALATAGEATAACWIGTERGDFATGHVDGSVLVWALPGLDPGDAAATAALRVVDGAAEPVRMLRSMFGEADGLLVLGGQEVEQPEALTWLPLPDAAGEEAEEEAGLSEEASECDSEGEGLTSGGRSSLRSSRRAARRSARRKQQAPAPIKLPWFGHVIGFCLVADGGCVTGYEAPTGVLQLVEGGQLVLFDLRTERPLMVGPRFQQRTNITVTEAALVPVRRPTGSGSTTISLAGLRKVAAELTAEAGGEEPAAEAGVFHSGVAPPQPADASWGLVYCTGYKDGGVCLWDLQGGTTRLLCSAPAGEAAEAVQAGGSSGSVSCVSVVWPTGLVLVGHHKGEVRMYQFSPVARNAECIMLDSVNTAGEGRHLHQQAGLQLRLRVQINSSEITSLAYCQSIRAVAAGDKVGGVALIDTAKPLVRWYAMPLQQAVLACGLAPVPLPPTRLRVPEVVGEDGAPSHAVLLADSEGCIAALDAARGCFIGRGGALSPRNHSYTLVLELLDEEFCPLWARRQVGAGCDQAALGGSGGALSQYTPGRSQSSARPEAEEEEEEDTTAPSTRGRSSAGRRGGSGRDRHRGPGPDGSSSEEEEEEYVDDADVDTLLARAAVQVERPRRFRKHGQSRDASPGASSGPPAALSSCPDPAAHYVLQVTDQYLRLYSASNVVAAERSTVAKRSPAGVEQLVYARPVQGPGGAAGVLALASAEHGLCVQVYSLPSLDLVHEAPLSSSLSWYWDVPPGHERRLGRMAATSRLGHLLLLGLSNELITLGVTAGLQPAPAPRLLFDQSAATASLAAAVKYVDEHSARPGRLTRGSRAETLPKAPERESELAPESVLSDPVEGVDSPIVRTEGRRIDKSAVPTTVAVPLVTFTRVFNRMQQGLTRAVEETTKGVRQLATNVEKGVATVGAALIDGGVGTAAGPSVAGVKPEGSGFRRHSVEWYASLPDLGAVFSRTVPEEDATLARMRRKQARKEGRPVVGSGGEEGDDDDDDISILTITDEDEDEEPSAPANTNSARRPTGGSAATAPPPPPPRGQQVSGAAAGARSAGGDDAGLRNELFAGARPYTSAGGGAAQAGPSGGVSNPRTRTADEIKRAYGRAPAEGGRAGAAASRANDVRSVMEDNRSKLAERGEKLRQLNDKTADLESSAAGFAEMARQLAERERNKKWWQL